MPVRSATIWLLLAFLLPAGPFAAAQTEDPAVPADAMLVDRIAVSVGSEVITEADLWLDLRITAFLDRLPVDFSPAAKRRAAERLVDQILILREASESRLELPVPDPAALLRQVRVLYPSDDQYHADLKRYQIEEQDLTAHLLASARTLTFADLRFRPTTQISEADLRGYFEELMRARAIMTPPRADQKPAPPPSFEDSRDDLEILLSGQKSLEALDHWLETMQMSVRIEYRDHVFEPRQEAP